MTRLRARRDDVVMADVRSPSEYAAVHIEGSVSIPQRTLPSMSFHEP